MKPGEIGELLVRVAAAADGAASDNLAGELKDFVKARIGAWKHSRWIEIVQELPKTATGKIRRFKLREDAQ